MCYLNGKLNFGNTNFYVKKLNDKLRVKRAKEAFMLKATPSFGRSKQLSKALKVLKVSKILKVPKVVEASRELERIRR